MKWNKFTLKTRSEVEDIVISTLADVGIEGVEIQDKQPLTESDKQQMFVDIMPDIPDDDGIAYLNFYLDVDEDKEKVLADVRAALAEMQEFLDLGECTITESETEDKDWINNWKQYFKQFYVDDMTNEPESDEAMKENAYKPSDWLPTSVKEVRARGWDTLDVILFTGDAYVDHPSFGPAVVGRLLEAEGLRVAIVPQPNWRDDLRDFRKLGRPRLFFGVSAGNMDSMVNHYTANKRLRSDDAYTAGGQAGFRPDYAATVYTRILKRLFPDTPVVLGGIEASLRRLTHYDYWSDSLKPSILIDSGADLLAYGMGDRVMPEIARAARNGFNMHLLKKLPQVAFVADRKYADSLGDEPLRLYPFERCLKDKRAFGENFRRIETESNRMEARTLVEETEGRFVVVNPPYPKLSEQELDRSFALPYTRLPHPRYNGKGDIPAYEMIKFSVNLHRGCFGGCSFCTISAHQGKFVSSRSERSVLDEVRAITVMPGFKGYLSDLGGPSANMCGKAVTQNTASCPPVSATAKATS